MLILTRCIGQVICIGDDFKVTVLGIRGNQVKLGITAPSDVGVHREEVYKRIIAEKLKKLEEKEKLLATSEGA